MDCQYAINGQKLDARYCRVLVGSSWLAGVSPRRDVVTIPGVNGSVASPYSPVFDERELTIKIGIAGESSYTQEINRIAALCAQSSVTVSRMVGGVMQSAVCELKSLAPDGDEVLGRIEQLTAVFAMPGVWWRGASYKTASGSFRQAGNAPITDAIIRLSAAQTTSITDNLTGTGVSWSGNASGNVFLDPLNLRAWSGDADAWDGGVDVSAGLDWPAGGPLQLLPDQSGNVGVTVKGAGITIRYRDSWW